MKKFLSIFFSISIIFCFFTACSKDGSGEQMVFPIDSEPQYLDPQIVSEKGAANIIQNCFEGLVTYDESGKIIPAGCESYSVSPDGTTYTFSLRENAKWKVSSSAKALFAEGEFEKFDDRVTAADYVFAFRRVADSETGSPAFAYISSVKNAKRIHEGKLSKESLGVRAEGDFTLVIELERADGEFIFSLTRPAFVPCNETFFEMTKGRYCLSVSNIISNGPFFISNWADNTAITARKSDTYHSADSVLPSSVYFSFNNEKGTRGEKVKDGIYEVAPVDESQADELSAQKNITVRPIENSCFALLFNCSNDYLKNAYLRAALAASLEKKYFLEDGGEEASGIVPPSSTFSGASYRKRAGIVAFTDSGSKIAGKYLQKAQEALERESFSLSVLCDEENELNVRKVMQNWQSVLNVKSSITVEVVDSQTLLSRVESGDFQLAFSELLLDGDTAQSVLLRFSKNSANNVFGFSSNRYETLLTAAQNASDEREFLSALKAAERYLADNAVIVPIEKRNGYFAQAKGVSGVIYSPGGEFVYFRNAVKK
ncbi:MAG: peptide ABC transporter substrate-binding protein [Clostridia bacterium]|nr:peptide ABC transporter substrate-binding protein [Clostridia bacterium]